jgi:hypothetical protein
MNTAAQDWTMRDATREILVLTKTDEEPENFGEVCAAMQRSMPRAAHPPWTALRTTS